MSVEAGIVIVGAGPTGLTLACELLRRGVPCRLLEQSEGRSPASRAVGLSTRSLEILDEFDAAGDAVDRGHPLRAANLYSRGRRIAQVGTSRIRWTRYPFILSLPQDRTEEVLERRLADLGGNVERGVRIWGLHQDGDMVMVECDGAAGTQRIEASWLIGTDGAHSTVRRLADISFAGEATEVVFTIVDAELDGGPARGEAHYFFSADGLLVVVPLPEGRYRIAATVHGSGGEVRLEPGSIQGLLDTRASIPGLKVGRLEDAGWGAGRVRIHSRLADRFRAGSCLLAGDAAHVHSPVGGQGVNVGIQDAHNLAWRLALVARGDASQDLLDSYEAERRPVAELTRRAVTGQTRLAAIGSRPSAFLRDTAIKAASRRGALDRRMAPQLAQLAVDYSASPAVDAAPRRLGRSTPMIGRRIPDVELGRGDDRLRLFELLRGSEFTALVLGCSRDDAGIVARLDEQLGDRREGLIEVVPVSRPGVVGPPGALIDPGGDLHRLLEVGRPELALVRPDFHLAFRGPAENPRALVDCLDRMLGVVGRRSSKNANEKDVRSI